MNYRHTFHAGNFADVVKHVALTAILLHLKKKQAPFVVIDTHAGRGLYDLSSPESARTGEASSGIDRVLSLTHGPAALLAYLAIVCGSGERCYPGSPLIAARLKRPEDRLIAIESEPEEAALLASALAPFRKARAMTGDGYAELRALLPPPERRGVVMIDPPFERVTEFADVAGAIADARQRFATGIFLVWFPLKSLGEADAFAGEIAGTHALQIEFDCSPGSIDQRLHAAGVLVINPPFGFDDEMRKSLGVLELLLGAGESRPAQSRITALPRSGRQAW
jgi:23S rRNA (adenine2030-N6)-methyltransferase